MRVAIPAVVLLIEGAETGMASFFIAILNSLRISEKKTADSVTLSAAPLGQGA
jgi:hypothetical protein